MALKYVGCQTESKRPQHIHPQKKRPIHIRNCKVWQTIYTTCLFGLNKLVCEECKITSLRVITNKHNDISKTSPRCNDINPGNSRRTLC